MSRIRPFVVAAVVACMGIAAESSQAALAKKAGGSGLSGTLSSNKAIKKQQLICDPDEPTAGSISVQYDPSIVGVSGFSFGLNYGGQAFVQLDFGEGNGMVPLSRYLADDGIGFASETGFLQVVFSEPSDIGVAPSAFLPHGQIPVAAGYTTVDTDGPAAVDTHAFVFDYLDEVPDGTVATYKIFAATAGEYGGFEQGADYLSGFDGTDFYTVEAGDIASATVSGSLNTAPAVPLPPAVLVGGLTMAGTVVAGRLRRRRTA